MLHILLKEVKNVLQNQHVSMLNIIYKVLHEVIYITYVSILLPEMSGIILRCNNTCYRITYNMFKLSRQDSSTEITKILNTSNILISYKLDTSEFVSNC